MTSRLTITDLKIAFQEQNRTTVVLDGLNLQLESGVALGIVGESGSGKTLLALSIMDLLPNSARVLSGEVQLKQSDSSLVFQPKKSQEARKIRGQKVSMIFQEPMTSLNPVLTCGDQVSETIQLLKKVNKSNAQERTIELFAKVALENPKSVFNKYPHQLSGGQRQRVMIAMALAGEPDFLIADEPTTALDVITEKSILDLLNKLKEEGLGILFISHDLGVLSRICRDIVVLYQGKIIESQSMQDLLKQPQHWYTKGLLACRPPIHEYPIRLTTIEDYKSNTSQDKNKMAIISKIERLSTAQKLGQNRSILTVKNLNVHFPVKNNFWGTPSKFLHAVNDISFNLHQGEILGLVGASGCGKSSLAKAIAGLIKPTTGSIEIAATNSGSKSMTPPIQMIFQDPFGSLNPRMTVGQTLIEPLEFYDLFKNKKERIQAVYKMLNQVGLNESYFNRYPNELSGGQRQRVCIGRSLLLNPTVLICDESVTALDVSIQAQIINLILDIREEHEIGILFIGHDLSVVKYVSDRILVMNKGRIVESGYSDALFDAPTQKYTQKLAQSISYFEN